MVVEELEQVLGLLLLETDDAAGEALVDVQGLLTGHGVNTNERMLLRDESVSTDIFDGTEAAYLALNRLAANRSVALPGVLSLVDSRVDGAEALETLLEFRRQPVVSLNLRGKECVTTAVVGLVKDPEEGGARGLLLVRLFVA